LPGISVIETLRKDLASTSIPEYKFPTAVHWLREEERLPCGRYGKGLEKRR
jgi:hypothetical protein